MILRLVLGDQLNYNHSWFENSEENITYCLFELHQEQEYVTHHIQKIVGFFASMRAFAEHLKKQGHHVIYWEIDHQDNTGVLTKNLDHLIDQLKITRFEYQKPNEYRLVNQLSKWVSSLSIENRQVDTEHFLSSPEEFHELFKGKKTFLLERFYRYMRKKYNILMQGDQPYGERWNYDGENRKKLPHKVAIPEPIYFDNDVSSIFDQIESSGIKYIGKIDPSNFQWPINRSQSLEILNEFVQTKLHAFGKYQDAMSERSWILFHSRLSFSLNTKMISPLEVIEYVIQFWKENSETIDIAQVEGFVRQILGWREYMRCIYELKMPEYASLNFLEHSRALPKWFWTGETKMRCMSHSITQSLEHAYAHHIQRLMITGNFSLLAGIDPSALDEWYLGIYIDAIQWVEITNTRGMSQFADGGIVGTKPYVSTANYIDKMGHYCKHCHYNKKLKTGADSCPFNSLYWDFYDRHKEKLSKNPRIGMAYRLWNKMDGDKKEQILLQAQSHLDNIENL